MAPWITIAIQLLEAFLSALLKSQPESAEAEEHADLVADFQKFIADLRVKLAARKKG